jgi:O-antigen biosynthesis protein WbqP
MNTVLKALVFLAMIALSPIIIISIILILIEDGRPAIFVQERLGKNKKIIKIYKIRTMNNLTPNLGTHEINLSNHLRIGVYLRKFKIDELPQLINYIKGDVQLVGPRPCLPNQKELVNLREKNQIFDIKPGITGLAQVLGYDMSDPRSLLQIEKIYADKKTLKLNLLIFFSTFFNYFKNIIRNDLKEDIQNINQTQC